MSSVPNAVHACGALPLALNDLARERLAAGIDVYLERVTPNQAPDAPVTWARLRMDMVFVDKLVTARECCPAIPSMDTGPAQRIEPDPWWNIRVTRNSWMCGQYSAGLFTLAAEVSFAPMFAALNSLAAPRATCGPSCFWYGGALVCATSDTVHALAAIEANCPELVARQREIEMAAAVGARAALPTTSCTTAPPARRACL